MADLDERLNQLISDQESMKKVLAMAKAILAQRDSASPEPAASAPAPPEPQPQTTSSETSSDIAAMLSAIMAKSAESPAETSTPDAEPALPLTQAIDTSSLSPLAAMLPQLMQIFSGNGNLVKSERVNLLQAMRPYLKESRASSIDRALKMANATKAATSAMHLLGR